MFDQLAHLDAQQLAVATKETKRLRVLAGAGTGKTTALTARTAQLVLSGGVPAERVLLLTFTRRAARQMTSRTATIIARAQRNGASGPKAGRIVGGTFHSVAHQTLRRHAQAIGLSPGFGVLDPADSADLIDVVRDQEINEATLRRRIPRKATLLSIYSRAVASGTPISDVVAKTAPWAQESTTEIASICQSYVARKTQLGVLDFDDLLLYWREALLTDSLGDHLARRYDHILVDEYQDVNALQVEILQMLCRHDTSLTVVGDDAQAIYSFRASSPAHILQFEDDFPDAETLALTTNYRSTQPILTVANAIASEAKVGFTTVLQAYRAEQASAQRPRVVRCSDEDGQSDAVCTRILELREQGVSLAEQAILIRAAHHSESLELELTRRGIPFVKYGGLKYLEAAHVKDLLAAFRIADNPADELSWFRVLQLLPGVGPAKARRGISVLGLGTGGSGESTTHIQLQNALPELIATLGIQARDEIKGFVAALQPIQHEPLVGHAQRLREAIAPLIASKYDNSESRITDLEALVQAAASAALLSEVAAEHALEPPSVTSDLAGDPSIDEDYLVISTVHSAKGLEWDAVHIVHAADGNFPSDMALSDDDGLEEERRLFYVAATRARNYLDVYVPLRFHVNRRSRDDRHVWGQPSRFISGAASTAFDESTHLRPNDFGAQDIPGHAVSSFDVSTAVTSNLNRLWR